jgi:hypothetical protein
VLTPFAKDTAGGGRVVAVSAGSVTRGLSGMQAVAGLNQVPMGSNCSEGRRRDCLTKQEGRWSVVVGETRTKLERRMAVRGRSSRRATESALVWVFQDSDKESCRVRKTKVKGASCERLQQGRAREYLEGSRRLGNGGGGSVLSLRG